MASISGAPIGVFVGSFCKDWTRVTLRDPDAVPMYQMSGSEDSLLANRLSYFFNLSGPSMLIGTACSSTLVALHLACTTVEYSLVRVVLKIAVVVPLCLRSKEPAYSH